MLEKCDLTEATDEKTLAKSLPPLQERLGVLQRDLHDRKVPVIIVIEGWNASGITMSTREIIRSLDPRGFTLYATHAPTPDELSRPFMWRFWTKIPERGRIAIFARSWYSRAITEELDRPGWKKSFRDRIVPINTFERQLADDGIAIIKFFLHIDKDEQKRRIVERERNPLTAWLVTPRLWDIHAHYDENLPVIDELVEETDTDLNPWHVIPATDPGFTLLKIHSVLVKRLEEFAGEGKKSGKGKNRSEGAVIPKKTKIKRASSLPHPIEKAEW
jgi:polyphosphate kinase 2 (PPK2 family)